MSTVFLAATFLLLASVAATKTPDSIFDVTAFGAVADGKKDCTQAIRRAAAALAANGGGTLLFPSKSNGESSTFLSGSFNLTSHSSLLVE